MLSAAVSTPLVAACSSGGPDGGARAPVAGTTASSAVPAASASGSPTAEARTTPAAGSEDFGYLVAVRSADAPVRLSFDKALFLTGEAANTAAAAHGDETPVPNDYYVVNDNPLLRTVVLARDVQVLGSLGLNSFVGDSSVALRPRTVAQLLEYVGTEPGRRTGFRLRYGAGGLVVRVQEQYVP